MMSILAALLVLSAPGHQAPTAVPAATQTTTDREVERAALAWLTLVDAGRWTDSWAATGASFRSLNTVDAWQAASEKARGRLGRVITRTPIDQRDVPAPPNGYRMIRFKTDFANQAGVTETLSLDREGGDWKVVGIYLE